MSGQYEHILEEYQKRVEQGERIEDVIADLRANGLSMFDSIRAVKKLYGLALKDAQQYVLEHPVWVNEARRVLRIEDIVQAVEANPSFFAWLEWYYEGSHSGMMMQFASPKGVEWERKIEARLQHAVQADELTQQQLIHDLADQSDDTLDVLIGIIGGYRTKEKAVVELALRTLRAIGYPRNTAAIRWLVCLASDESAPGRDEAIQTLRNMDDDEVVPYFLATLVNGEQDRISHEGSKWSRIVKGICSIVRVKSEWALACGPAVVNVLSQYNSQGDDHPDPYALLTVLEQTVPTNTYAVPALYHLALREKGSELGQKAYHLLLLFHEDILKDYRYHLQWLSEYY
jgi:hypothetical protein